MFCPVLFCSAVQCLAMQGKVRFMKLIRNRYKFEKTLHRFHIAYGFFIVSITFYKLVIEKMLIFRSSFLGFYFGSIILWFGYLFLAILSGQTDNTDIPESEMNFPTKKSGKYQLIFEFEKEAHAKKFRTMVNSMITHHVFGRMPISGWVNVSNEKNMGNN